MLQTVASLIDDARVIIYDRNMFTIQAAVKSSNTNINFCFELLQLKNILFLFAEVVFILHLYFILFRHRLILVRQQVNRTKPGPSFQL